MLCVVCKCRAVFVAEICVECLRCVFPVGYTLPVVPAAVAPKLSLLSGGDRSGV
jgi:hypothetical protein